MTSPYRQRLEQQRANIVARRVALRKHIQAFSSGAYGSGDFIDRRRAREVAEIALRAADREYEEVMVKLGRENELYQPPVSLRLTPAEQRAVARAKAAKPAVRLVGHTTKVMTPQRPPIDWSAPLRRDARGWIARDVEGGFRYLPSTR